MEEQSLQNYKADFRAVPKRKMSEAEKHMLLIAVERMKLQREKALLILSGSIMLFFAFIGVAVVGLLNELITRNMLNMLDFVIFCNFPVKYSKISENSQC